MKNKNIYQLIFFILIMIMIFLVGLKTIVGLTIDLRVLGEIDLLAFSDEILNVGVTILLAYLGIDKIKNIRGKK